MDTQKRKKLSKAERIEVYNKTFGHCSYCGCVMELKEMQADHFKPLYNGGEDILDNLIPSCRSCNHYKSTCDLETFRKSIERFPEVLLRDSVTYKNAVRYGLVIPKPAPIIFFFEKIGLNISKEEGCIKD